MATNDKADKKEELKEVPYNSEDINMVLLTEEHLQRVVKEAVCEGIEEYFKKTGIERLLKDVDLD